jgi:hypothetical protein
VSTQNSGEDQCRVGVEIPALGYLSTSLGASREPRALSAARAFHASCASYTLSTIARRALS